MFGIGFFELVLISVIGLLVLGPERLPGAIRTTALWVGRLRRNFNDIKTDIEREIGADEIRRQLRNEAILEKFKNTRSQFTEMADSVKKEIEGVEKEVNQAVQIDDPSRAQPPQGELSLSGEDKVPTGMPTDNDAPDSASSGQQPPQEKQQG
jgi:sec-independent protein translocase protein TatB